jgi:hypothetical protein
MLAVRIAVLGLAAAVAPGQVFSISPLRCRCQEAEDASRTRILGNFQYHNRSKKIDMSSASWKRKTLEGAHAKMELDPEVWARVERFIWDAMGSEGKF